MMGLAMLGVNLLVYNGVDGNIAGAYVEHARPCSRCFKRISGRFLMFILLGLNQTVCFEESPDDHAMISASQSVHLLD